MTSDLELVGLARSNSTIYCRCIVEDLLIRCLSCGSFFELGTFNSGY